MVSPRRVPGGSKGSLDGIRTRVWPTYILVDYEFKLKWWMKVINPSNMAPYLVCTGLVSRSRGCEMREHHVRIDN
jgi:hypothetical protein